MRFLISISFAVLLCLIAAPASQAQSRGSFARFMNCAQAASGPILSNTALALKAVYRGCDKLARIVAREQAREIGCRLEGGVPRCEQISRQQLYVVTLNNIRNGWRFAR